MRNSLAAKESFIGIQRVFCCQLHNLPLPVTESCIGSQRAFHRHSKSLSLPAKGSFIGNQTVIHRQLPTGRGLLCIFLKTPPRCGTTQTFKNFEVSPFESTVSPNGGSTPFGGTWLHLEVGAPFGATPPYVFIFVIFSVLLHCPHFCTWDISQKKI